MVKVDHSGIWAKNLNKMLNEFAVNKSFLWRYQLNSVTLDIFLTWNFVSSYFRYWSRCRDSCVRSIHFYWNGFQSQNEDKFCILRKSFNKTARNCKLTALGFRYFNVCLNGEIRKRSNLSEHNNKRWFAFMPRMKEAELLKQSAP